MLAENIQSSMPTGFVNISGGLACGSHDVSPYLDLGSQPLAIRIIQIGAKMEVVPLVLQYCEISFSPSFQYQ